MPNDDDVTPLDQTRAPFFDSLVSTRQRDPVSFHMPGHKFNAGLLPELTEALEPLVPNYDAILMANHGVVTYGPDLLTAWFRMETTEHFARVSLVTELLGKQVLLSNEEVDKLLAARARYGLTTAAQVGPECPVTLETAGADRVTCDPR